MDPISYGDDDLGGGGGGGGGPMVDNGKYGQGGYAGFTFLTPTANLPANDVAKQRAAKAGLALGPGSETQDQLIHIFSNRLEDRLADTKIRQEDLAFQGAKTEILSNYMRNRGDLPISPEEVQAIRDLNRAQVNVVNQDPNTFFERMYGQRIAQAAAIAADQENKVLQKARKENEELAQSIIDSGADFIAKKEVVQKLLEEHEQQWKDRGTAAKVLDYGMTFMPLVSDANRYFNTDTKAFLGGNQKQEIARKYYEMTVDKGKPWLEEQVKKLAANNPLDAEDLLQYIMSGTAREQFWSNVATGVDAATSGAIGALKKTIKGAADSVAVTRTTQLADGAASSGAVKTGTKILVDEATNPNIPKDVERVMNATPSIHNVNSIANDTKVGLSAAEKDRVIERLKDQATKLQNLVGSVLKVDRIDPTSATYQTMIAEADKLARREFNRIEDTILDVRPRHQAATNTDHIDITFGQRGGGLFTDAETAHIAAKDFYGLGKYELEQIGAGWGIKVSKPLDESSVATFRALKQETDKALATPRNPINAVIGWFRSGKYLIPDDINRELVTAEFASNYLSSTFKDLYKSFKKGDAEALTEFVEKQRVTKDPATGIKGKFSETIGDFEKDFLDQHKVMPTESQTLAYFTMRQMNDLDYALRNMAIYRDKSRLGLQMFQFDYNGVKIKEPNIEGKLVSQVPLHHKEWDAGVLVWNRDPQLLKTETSYRPNVNFVKAGDLEELYKQGYKVIQLSPTGQKQLKAMPYMDEMLPKGDITYVLVKDVKSGPLSMQQLPFRPGFHHESETKWYLRQPDMRFYDNVREKAAWYFGDKNVVGFSTEHMAKKYTPLYEDARKAMLDVDTKRANEAVLEAAVKKLPLHTVEDFRNLFDKYGLDKNTPFYYTAKNDSVHKTYGLDKIHSDYKFFENNKSPHNLYNDSINLAYAQERGDGIMNVVETGSKSNPIVDLKPAPLVDVMQVVDRSARNILESVVLDDAKHKVGQRFVTEFGHLIDASPQELQRNPYKYVMETPWRTDIKDKTELAAAKGLRRVAQQVLSITDENQKVAVHLQNKAVDFVDEVLGSNKAAQADAVLDSMRKLPAAAKRMVFDLSIGLFNPVQLGLQASTGLNAIAIIGKDAVFSSWGGAMLMRTALNASKDEMEILSAMAKKVGVKDFETKVKAFLDSGFAHVAGTYGDLPDKVSPSMTGGMVSGALEKGRVFFNNGEQFARLIAWNNAWDEAAKAGKVNPKDVLARAVQLTGDMDNVGKAGWQDGIPGIITQFLAYNVRLAEQMWGHKLTSGEKARLLLTHGALYGAPAAGGLFWPSDWTGAFNQEKFNEAKTPDWIDKMNHGLAAAFGQWLTGTEFDVGSRYGGGNFQFWRNLLDKKFMESFSGPLGKRLLQLKNDDFPPLWESIKRMANGEGSVSVQDFSGLFSQISTVDSGIKLWYALQYGKYVDKNAKVQADMSAVEAVVKTLTGVSPQRFSDMYDIIKNEKAIDEAKKKAEAQIVKYLRDSMEPGISSEDAAALRKKAEAWHVLGGFEPHESQRIFKRTFEGGYLTQADRIFNEWYLKKPEERAMIYKKLMERK